MSLSPEELARSAAAALEGTTSSLVTARVIETAVRAAAQAGELQRAAHGRLGSADVRTKSSRRDLVTTVDVESERLLVEQLRALPEGWSIEAEEEVQDARDGGPRWFVDPLDGTVNFFHGLPLYCVSLGLFEGSDPLLGVIHAPALGETFVCARGAGAFALRSMDGEVHSLAVSAETTELGDAVLATGFPYRRGELEHSNLENFNRFYYDVRGLRRMGSAALDLAFVAAGRLDGFWELHLSPFDVAAGAALVREAGGEVTDAAGGQDWLRGGSIVAAPAALAAEMRARVEA